MGGVGEWFIILGGFETHVVQGPSNYYLPRLSLYAEKQF